MTQIYSSNTLKFEIPVKFKVLMALLQVGIRLPIHKILFEEMERSLDEQYLFGTMEQRLQAFRCLKELETVR